ncbi:ABC transporter substrate-binding protein [Deinococcus cellulosilyticus]|uniref:Branched-chain amino acid ABC transporter substrate-binding protein n=1 Tax=Deinococcus cellulosilyticus (strain DSM 18568 / NBRC 106333 / KACC 11606 / 5516J-15) TaxID=1223518 RepID=A0A511N351_DEIC1|nr:ABC transporter substrate-binding protein [Deinococcus cellulosilyticus]GEM46846.1 branched-chain amino acid ABC transporter substrate-binding protein [Deinococcus cellulosilyticus NBRC 106333 = KACC 11606]
MKKSALLLITLGLSGALAQSTDTIKVGAITSLTGRFATFGKMQKAGFQVAIKEINSRGGVLGKKLELVLEDDASDTNKALAAAEKLVNQGVPLIIGAYASSITKPLSQYLTREKVPLLVATAVDDTITNPGSPYVFRVNNASKAYTQGFIELFRKLQVKTIAVLTSNDAFGKSVMKDITTLGPEAGFKIVAQDSYDQGLSDFRPILNRFKSLDPDVVYLASYEADSVTIMRQSKEVGLKPRFFAGAATGFALPSFAKAAGDAAEGTLVSVTWSDDVRYAGALRLYKSLKTELKEEPSQHAAQSYAAMLAAADAIQRAGGLDREKVQQALKKTLLVTAYGPVKFRDYDGFTNQNPVVILITQVQKGKVVTVYPDRVSEAKVMEAK